MINDDPLYEQWRERDRARLSPVEEAQLREWLASNPARQAEWEFDAALDQALAGLRDVPVASNFTARVVKSAQLEAARQDRKTSGARRPNWLLRMLPRVVLPLMILLGGLASYHHLQETRRFERAQSLEAVSHVPVLPNPEILKDFDAIAALSSTPPADEELLRVMQ